LKNTGKAVCRSADHFAWFEKNLVCMKKLLSLVLFSMALTLISCDDEPESIGSVPSGKTFSLVVPEIGRSIAKSIIVSENGEHIYMQAYGNVSNSLFYSSDGGETFVEKNAVSSLDRITGLDNDGTFVTSRGALFLADGTDMTSGLPGYQVILGDNGKVFAYSMYGDLKYRNTNEYEWQTLTPPAYAGWSLKVVKAPGLGFAIFESISPGSPLVKAHVIEESSLEMTSYELTIDHAQINGCNNLNAFLGFDFQYNNMVVIKGCSGLAIYDLSANTVEYRTYPDIDNPVYTDLRDYPVQMDDDGNIYVTYATYANAQVPSAYRFEGNDLVPLEDFYSDSNIGGVFLVNHNTAYYNSNHPEETIITSMVKENLSSGAKTQLRAVTEPIPVLEAVAVDDHTVLLIAEGRLYKYDANSSILSRYDDLEWVSHVNVLSDGRWVAGGQSKLYLSGNDGSSWTTEENIFASSGNSFSVNETRIIDGKLFVLGTNAIPYYNQTTGMTVMQYDNHVVVSGGPGSWSSANYQALSGFRPTCIGHDGTLYGGVEFVDPFTNQSSSIPYAAREGGPPVEFPAGTPALVTDKGEHITLHSATSNELEIMIRPGEDGEWKSTGSKFVSSGQIFGDYQIKEAGGPFTLVYHSEVYVLK
jgi:hypothetical protein